MKLLNSFDSYFNKSTQDIPLLKFLYVLSLPFALLLIKYKFKPNTITTLSNVSVFLSFVSILYFNSISFFIFFWLFGLILDICDGIVSRKTNQQSANGSFYDHFTDQIKIFLLFLTVGIYFNSFNIWILSSITSNIFLLYSLLSYMTKYRMRILNSNSENKKNLTVNKNMMILKKYTYNNIFIIQGNFIVFLGFMFFHQIVYYMFIIIIFILVFNLFKSIKYMINLNNDLMRNNLKWN